MSRPGAAVDDDGTSASRSSSFNYAAKFWGRHVDVRFESTFMRSFLVVCDYKEDISPFLESWLCFKSSLG